MGREKRLTSLRSLLLLTFIVALILATVSYARREDDEDEEDLAETNPSSVSGNPPTYAPTSPQHASDHPDFEEQLQSDDSGDEPDEDDESEGTIKSEPYDGPDHRKKERHEEIGEETVTRLRQVRAEIPWEKQIQDYSYELMGLVLIILYILNYFYGQARNETLAKAWLSVHSDLFSRNFSLLGHGEGYLLIRDGPADYLFYGSGRVHCKSMAIKLQLRKRHDLSSYLVDFVFPSHDRLVGEIILNEEQLPGFILAVMAKRKERTLKTERWDVSTFTKQIPVKDLPDTLRCYSDCPEAAESLLISPVLSSLIHADKLFEYLIVSDRPSVAPKGPISGTPSSVTGQETMAEGDAPLPAKKYIEFSIRLDGKETCDVNEVLETILNIMDMTVMDLDLDPLALGRLKKKRAAVDEQLYKATAKERQEAEERKAAEKRRKEREELEKMDWDARERLEDKMRQKQAKKKNKLKTIRG